MASDEQLQRLKAVDPFWMDIEQQCAFVLKCIEADFDLQTIFDSKFKGDKLAFGLIMSLITKKGWAGRNKESGRWYIKKMPKLNFQTTPTSASA